MYITDYRSYTKSIKSLIKAQFDMEHYALIRHIPNILIKQSNEIFILLTSKTTVFVQTFQIIAPWLRFLLRELFRRIDVRLLLSSPLLSHFRVFFPPRSPLRRTATRHETADRTEV